MGRIIEILPIKTEVQYESKKRKAGTIATQLNIHLLRVYSCYQCSSSDTPVHLRAIAIIRNHTAKHYPLIFLSEIPAKSENQPFQGGIQVFWKQTP